MAKPESSLKDKMRSGIGGITAPRPARTTLFGDTTQPGKKELEAKPQSQAKEEPAAPVSAPRLDTDRQPKASVFTQRVTAVISKDQRACLEKLARNIQDNGIKKPERITSNTVMRCLINLLDGADLDISKLRTEDELDRLFKRHFRK